MESYIGRFSSVGRVTIEKWKLSGALSIPYMAPRLGELRRIRGIGCLVGERGSLVVPLKRSDYLKTTRAGKR